MLAAFVVAGATNAALLVRPDLLLASKNWRLVLVVTHLSEPLHLRVGPVIPEDMRTGRRLCITRPRVVD